MRFLRFNADGSFRTVVRWDHEKGEWVDDKEGTDHEA